ncbi:hypothetical protein D9M68_264070 [compost metagenome]
MNRLPMPNAITTSWRRVAGLAAAALLAGGMQTARAAPAEPTAQGVPCGSLLEAATWRLWDDRGHALARDQLIFDKLGKAGNTYALYDLQVYFQNLVAMAERCGREGRLRQIAMLVAASYSMLSEPPDGLPGRAWVCRGGPECRNSKWLLNSEVLLTSTQYLAFASTVARGLLADRGTQFSRNFVAMTADVAQEHLVRWSAPEVRDKLRQRIGARPQDVQDGSSKFFMTDKDLWQIAIYADFAGMMAVLPNRMLPAGDPRLVAMKQHLGLLLELFAARTTVQLVKGADGRETRVADIDAGYSRLYFDNRYASYRGREKPVECKSDPARPGRYTVITHIRPDDFAPVPDISWDFSHARRLVHVFEAIDRNRAALTRVFGIDAASLPARETLAAIARQVRVRVWNQDRRHPLFSNYLSGANGWYRVNYDNGTGYCNEGYPPFGLTDSFASGGYASWASLRDLGMRVYELSQSLQEQDRRYIDTYFPGLGAQAGSSRRMLAEIMFWPTLIGKPRAY